MVKFALKEIESIGIEYAKILKKNLKIQTIDDLVLFSPDEVSEKLNIEKKIVQQWFEIADLLKIPYLSIKYAEVLVFAKINSVEELAHRNAIRILYKFDLLDRETYHIIIKKPSLALIETWIYYAKLMIRNLKTTDEIPLILFPMVNLQIAHDFQKFQVITLRDLNAQNIKDIAKKVKMQKEDYEQFNIFKSIISIKGIGYKFADYLYQKKVHSFEEIKNEIVKIIIPLCEIENKICLTQDLSINKKELTDIVELLNNNENTSKIIGEK